MLIITIHSDDDKTPRPKNTSFIRFFVTIDKIKAGYPTLKSELFHFPERRKPGRIFVMRFEAGNRIPKVRGHLWISL